jgi:HD superfamily phosphodiesterase
MEQREREPWETAMLDLKPIVHAVLKEYALPRDGTHGVAHWARVLENGLRLAEETKARIDVVRLFAVFHDSRRINESIDDGHGRRGAELAKSFRRRTPRNFHLGRRPCPLARRARNCRQRLVYPLTRLSALVPLSPRGSAYLP